MPHSVASADGLCTIQVAPDAERQCSAWHVGRYSYTVDGTFQASITFVPEARSVTVTARTHTVERGAHLRLHGLLEYGTGGQPPQIGFTDMPVKVLARPDRRHPFEQIATAATGKGRGGAWPWWLDLHPKRTAIYIAEVTYQPGQEWWQNAASRPFKVRVSR